MCRGERNKGPFLLQGAKIQFHKVPVLFLSSQLLLFPTHEKIFQNLLHHIRLEIERGRSRPAALAVSFSCWCEALSFAQFHFALKV
ncbi:hypothetical protein ABKV19_025796 [Rosa sericea]